MSMVFDAQDWTSAASPGTTDDIPAALHALERGEYQPALTELEFACTRGDGLYPIAVPVIRCLVDSLPRCPRERQIMIVDFVSLLASRGDQPEARGTAAECARETIYAYAIYVHLLENAQSDDDRRTCVDMLGICALADAALRPRVVALLERVLRERADLASNDLRVLVSNTLRWIGELSLAHGLWAFRLSDVLVKQLAKRLRWLTSRVLVVELDERSTAGGPRLRSMSRHADTSAGGRPVSQRA